MLLFLRPSYPPEFPGAPHRCASNEEPVNQSRPRELSIILHEAIGRASRVAPDVVIEVVGEVGRADEVWIAEPDEQVSRLVGVLTSMIASADGRLALRWQARDTRVSVEVQAALRGMPTRNRLAAMSLPRVPGQPSTTGAR